VRYKAGGGDPTNAGLQHARAFLQPIKAQFPWITYSGLWTLAAVVAVKEIGEPEIEWKGGRTDFVDNSKLPPRGRLSDSAKGANHIRSISYRMGFNDREIVALSGVHNHWHCHSDRPWFEGKWVNNPKRFSNTHFRLLMVHDWKEKSLANWTKQYTYVDEDLDEELMILPTDIALPLFLTPWTKVGSASWTLSGLILALTTAPDTQMASELNVEERIQLAVKALQDGTIPSQRRAALLFNMPKSTLQDTDSGTSRFCIRFTKGICDCIMSRMGGGIFIEWGLDQCPRY
jgi:hypothetical protein